MGWTLAANTVLRKTVRREKLMELIVGLPPCLIGMEACGGAHEWARKFEAHGHRIGIMMARFVAPYRKSSKNDGNDAEAICEAVARPNMRFVPVKSRRAAGDSVAASSAAGVYRAAHGNDKPDARIARRVWGGVAAASRAVRRAAVDSR
jgi:transposase